MITIIDYGMGNLRSVQKGFEKVGYEAQVTNDSETIRNASKIVLPGVGAFKDAMEELRKQNLVEVIKEQVTSGQKPFLGICLGLQLLFDVSYEDGEFEGLGLVSGKVVRFDLPSEYSVPHMGWNQMEYAKDVPLLANIPDQSHVYFVHSYYVVPEDESYIATRTDYGGRFCSMIHKDNLYATQFHPEKSQKDGLQILKNFAEL